MADENHNVPPPLPGAIVAFISQLVDDAFRGGGPAEMPPSGRARTFLEAVRAYFDAEGIVFWRLEGPEYAGSQLSGSHRLVSGVSMFAKREGLGDRFEMRDLSLQETNSGRAFATNASVFGCEQGRGHKDYELPHKFHPNKCFAERDIAWIYAVPVISGPTNVYGVLSMYWRNDQMPFSDKSRDLFQIAATLWPGLYQRIRESRRLQLITAVDDILASSGTSSPSSADADEPIPVETADEVMRQICAKVGDLLHAEEVSIFLSPLRSSTEPKWGCRASNWETKPVRTFTPGAMPGITGWCLDQRVSIYIPDLHSFEDDRNWLDQGLDKNLERKRSLETVIWEDELQLRLSDQQQPEKPVRSFLAAPLIVEGALLGVIRCTSKANSPLIYFSNSDLRALEVVGTRIGQTWRNWQIAHSKSEQADAWRKFNDRSREITDLLSETIGSSDQAAKVLEQSVLEACQEALSRWGECSFTDLAPESKQPSDPEIKKSSILFKERYPGAAITHLVPGILKMAERQLVVYRTVLQLVEEVQAGTKQLNRALTDLRHQIVNPLNKALLRSNQHLRDFGHLSHVGNAVYPIRGLLRKSVHVADAFHLLVELEKTGKLCISVEPLKPRSIYILLTECIKDARLDIDPDRKIKIHLEENLKFTDQNSSQPNYATLRPDILLNPKLFEQVVNSLLENAVKYSNSNNIVLLEMRLAKEHLILSVRNRGAKLSPEEAPLTVLRNWRSNTAKKYVAEGTGIGLYLVKSIADAHGAILKVLPTDENGYTRVEFIIPSNNRIS